MKKILIWVERNWKKLGKDDVWILAVGLILYFLDKWDHIDKGYFTPYAVLVGYYLARKRFNAVDKQLNLATQRNDLDRYRESVKLLIGEEVTSQLAGVRGLTDLLESDSDEEKWISKEARISLETFLKENWRRGSPGEVGASFTELRKRHRVRDDILKALFCRYRKKEDNPDLSFLVLIETKLDRAKLNNVNLSSANLSGADLSGADLSGANLGGANLGDMRCNDPKLSGVNLDGENLGGANLSGANLSGANLGSANLSSANFNLTGFYSSSLGGAKLGGANLSGANLNGADLSGVNLGGANLSGVHLISANLSGVNLSSANLSGADLSSANLSSAQLIGADLSGANLSSARFYDSTLSDEHLMSVLPKLEIGPYKGIWAYQGEEPKGLSDILMDEVQANLKPLYHPE